MSRNWIIAGVAAVCFVMGVALSHRIEPGVRIENVMLTQDTPALRFIPGGPGPHPVALLAHGYAASKETLFRYGEALAAAGFICYSVDQPGHGSSPRKFTFMEAVQTLEAVAREIGPVDVFAGQSMGGGTGGEAVREGGMKPKLFIPSVTCRFWVTTRRWFSWQAVRGSLSTGPPQDPNGCASGDFSLV